MDVEQVADELYGLKPHEFTAARDAYVAAARRAKDTAAAKALAALRRPATAAWAANLLARQQPDEAARFLALGETLREAHRNLDGQQLRAASRQQHQLVTALARTAADLAREAGQPVSDTVLHEVEQTLHAALAHPDVAELWAKGRLAKVPEAAVGFGEIAPETVPARPAPAKASARKKSPDREEERRKAERESAQAEAKEAEAVVARRERELGEAQDMERAAAVDSEEAAERVRRLEEELAEARTTVRGTKTAAAEAEAAVKSADRALSQARRAAERAGREVERLKRAGR
ncbi:hypothetical protein [Streptomyces sp. CB02261]|uniref:hypothetical protein n=1 Tax=Streptomyces sp. CB02261 TaxID=1703940 RepID=UPI00093B429D|nr:hypothetical protein [Streptomyces sp. CB02261]OKJ61808.1 hypothetical protein AMK29_23625 [Streptomyces sp. CB02261]